MLEDLAFTLVASNAVVQWLTSFGFAVIGFLIAIVNHRDEVRELQRVPYFFLTSAVTMVGGVSNLLWFQTEHAMSGGYLWVLVLLWLIVSLGCGYGAGYLATLRSNNAYGDRSKAYLGIIPIANLLLVLKAPHEPRESLGVAKFALNALGVLLGIVMLSIGTTVARISDQALSSPTRSVATTPEAQRRYMQSLVKTRGLAEAIRLSANEVRTPMQVDEMTTLTRVDASANQITYIYTIVFPGRFLDEGFSDNLKRGNLQRNCNYLPMRPIIDAGGVIVHRYMDMRGTQWAQIQVDRAACQRLSQ